MTNSSFDEKTGRQAVWAKMDQELSMLLDPITGKVKESLVSNVCCPICDFDKYKYLFTKGGFDFVRCNHCDVIYVNPQLQEDITLEYYRRQQQGEETERTSSAMWVDVLINSNNQAWQVPYFEEAVNILSTYIPSKGLILDLGCSIGLFMEVAQRRSFECKGLELEPKAVRYAQSKGLDVSQQTLEEASFPDESFDAATMFGVLEHLQRPKTILEQVWKCLKPGGVLMAIVPNVTSLAAMTLHEQSRMFNGRNHLTYFSWKTLPVILQNAGYAIAHIDTCLTGLDSVLNYWQFSDPQGRLILEYLPPKLRALVEVPDNRLEVENMIREFGLGLRLRVVAVKPNG